MQFKTISLRTVFVVTIINLKYFEQIIRDMFMINEVELPDSESYIPLFETQGLFYTDIKQCECMSITV